MKIGYLTQFSPAEAQRARRLGFDCLEIHSGDYSADDVKRAAETHGISISAIAHYGPALTLKDAELLASFKKAIDLASATGANVVTTIAAREDAQKSVSDNIPAFAATYSQVAKLAEDKGVRIAFENWPAFRGYPWKGATMAHTPDAWERMFNAVPSSALGLEFDPSHLYWQGIDHITALKKFAGRVYHVHAKDTEIFEDIRNNVGIFGECWWTYRIPGLGAIDWQRFIAELHTLKYTGGVCIEHEDERFDCHRKAADAKQFERGLQIGLSTLRPLIG